MTYPSYTHPKTGKPITPLTPEEQLAWTGGQPMGWDYSPEMTQYMETARGLGIHPALGWLGNYPTWQDSAGGDVVEIEGKTYSVENINYFVENYPEGREWASKVSTQRVEAYKVDPQARYPSEMVTQVNPGDLYPLDMFMYNLNVSQMQGKELPTKFSQFRDPQKEGGGYGVPPTYGGYGAPATGYGTTAGQATTAFDYYPEYFKFMGEQRGKVSAPRYRYMESIFPNLTREFEAFMTKEFEGRQKREQPTTETWGEYLRKHPYGQEFSELSPYERGFRSQYQPSIQTSPPTFQK